MRVSLKAMQEFKEIYKEEFGEDLSDADADETALRVLRLFSILLKPLGEGSTNATTGENNF
jgi:hypothetical protein